MTPVSVTLNTTALLLFGLLTVFARRVSRRPVDAAGRIVRRACALLLGIVYIAARAALLRPLVLGRNQMLIYILIDAIPARILFPEELWPTILPIYYILLECFLLWSISGFFRQNEKQYRKFSAQRLAA